MATVFYPAFDLVRIDANGHRVNLASTTISAYNVTADSSLGTIASGTDAVVPAGSFTADVNDVVRFTHATYPGEHYVTLKSTTDEAFAANENAIAYILENLYTNTNEARAIHLYVEDTANPSKEPVLMGTGRPGETLLIPYQSNVSKTLNVHHLTQDDYGRLDAHEFKALTPVEVEVEPIDFSAAVPYKISQFTTIDEPDFADLITTVGSDLAMLWINREVEYTDGAAVNLPANIHVTVEKGGKLTNSGGDITINSFEASPTRQVFDGTGDVIVRAPELHLGWWAERVSTGDDQHAIDQLIASASYTASSQTYGVKVNLGAGKRWFNVAEVPSGTKWIAAGKAADPIDGVGGTHGFTAFPLDDTEPVFKFTGSKWHIHMEDFSIFSENTAECIAMEFGPGTVQVGLTFERLGLYRNSHGSAPSGGIFPTRLVEIIGTSSGGDITGMSFKDCWVRALDDVAGFHVDVFNSKIVFQNNSVLIGKTGKKYQIIKGLSFDFAFPDYRGGGGYSYSGYAVDTSVSETLTVTTASGSKDIVATSGSFDYDQIGQPCSHPNLPAGSHIVGIGPVQAGDTNEYTECKRARVSANATGTGSGTLTVNRKGVRINQEATCMYFGDSVQTVNIWGGLEEGCTNFLECNVTGRLCNINIFGSTPQSLITGSGVFTVNLVGGRYFNNSIIPKAGAYIILNVWGIDPRNEVFGETFELTEFKLVGPLDSGGVVHIQNWTGYRPGTSDSRHQLFGQPIRIYDGGLDNTTVNLETSLLEVGTFHADNTGATVKHLSRKGWRHPKTGNLHNYYSDHWDSNSSHLWITATNHPFPGYQFRAMPVHARHFVGDVLTPAQITSDTALLSLASDATTIIINSNAARYIAAVTSPSYPSSVATSGQRKRFINNGAFDITFKHNLAGPFEGHRFWSETLADVVLPAGGILDCEYDAVSTFTGGSGRWRILPRGGSGGVDTANSPNANEFARFTDADTIEGLTQAEMKTALAYGTMADQAASAVTITGGSITDVVISTGWEGGLQLTNTDPGTPRALNLVAAGATQSATRSLIFNVNNASRTLDLSGNLTVGSGGATVTGTNTGDNAVNSNYSGLAASKQDTLVSGTNIKTVNSASVLGSGDLRLPHPLFQHYVDANSGTSETTLYTYTLPANKLSTNGDRVRGFYAGTSAANASEKILYFYFGTSSREWEFFENFGPWRIEFEIIRVSNTVVRVAATLLSEAAAPSQTLYAEITSLNLSSNTYVIALKSATGDNAGDIVGKMGAGEFVPGV